VPFLRVVRDKRGYETTYLVHWFREGNRQRSRILYVFRTPGGVRVGRAPLEPDVLRQIEASHPGIAFDWNVIRENQQVVEAAPETRRRRPKREEPEESQPGPPPPAVGAPPADPPAPVEAVPEPSPEPASPPERLPVPTTIAGATPDEQIAFLNEWCPILRERIPARTSDPARREALLALVDRMEPSGWTDADQIAKGLEEATQAFERLSHVFARRRRRTRRRPADAPRPESIPSSSTES
jgi:hypothetical protein